VPHELDAALAPRDVVAGLPPGVRRLVAACAALYGGGWDDLAEDLRRRQAGRPYLFRLELPLDDVLGWVERLKNYERARGEALAAALGDDL
jgi:hypothetical protein